MVVLTAYWKLADSQCSSLLIIINDQFAFTQEYNVGNSRHGEKPVTSYHLKHFIRGSWVFEMFSTTENVLFLCSWHMKMLGCNNQIIFITFHCFKNKCLENQIKYFCIQRHLLHYLKYKVIRNIFMHWYQLWNRYYCKRIPREFSGAGFLVLQV